MLYRSARKIPYNHRTYQQTKIKGIATKHVISVTIGSVVEDNYYCSDFNTTIYNHDWEYSTKIAEAVAKRTNQTVTLTEIGYKNRTRIVWKK